MISVKSARISIPFIQENCSTAEGTPESILSKVLHPIVNCSGIILPEEGKEDGNILPLPSSEIDRKNYRRAAPFLKLALADCEHSSYPSTRRQSPKLDLRG